MLRFLVLLLLVIAFWLLLDWLYRKGARALGVDPDRTKTRGGGATPPGQPEHLVRCAACGAYVPASRALSLEGRGGKRGGEEGASYACSEVCRHRLRTGAAP
jgi:hypothetical protein